MTASLYIIGHSNRRHGYAGTKTYGVWASMKGRCNNPNHQAYADYGGRGIKVCARWDTDQGGSFENFLADMGEKPPELSLDRIDNNQGYSPENCRWATWSEQNLNKRTQSHCKNGHPLTPETTYMRASGKRLCKICNAAYQKAQREAKKAAA